MQAGSVIGTVLSGRYRLESKLGSGGMSTVYLATDETLERRVAVKLLHARDLRPARPDRALPARGAVGRQALASERRLGDRRRRGRRPPIHRLRVRRGRDAEAADRAPGRLPLDESAAYAIEVGRGLAAAHGRKLVHRDVKPQNVLIDPDGRAKVTDFGIARSLEAKGLTATGRVLGTTDYVAPEQAMGQSIDARSDIYSLGVLLYEMLDRRGSVPGRDPGRRGDEARQRAAARRAERGVRRSRRRWRRLSRRATAKDPEQRYADDRRDAPRPRGALEVEVAARGSLAPGRSRRPRLGAAAPAAHLHAAADVRGPGILLVLAAAAAAVAIVAITCADGR